MIIEKNIMSAPPTSSCQRFIQNAWKKDLCSNCFKPKEEHVVVKIEINTPLKWELNDLPPPPSILKRTSKKSKGKTSVTFNAQESEVIGYGGNDEYSDDDDDFFDENPKYEGEDLPDNEYEKQLQQLTKSNTDFNTITENLNKNPSELTKPHSPLKLGRPDLNTNKKPVQISVQPFGANTKPTVNKVNTAVQKSEVVETVNKNNVTNLQNSQSCPDGISKTNITVQKTISNTTDNLKSNPSLTNNVEINQKSTVSNTSPKNNTPKVTTWKTSIETNVQGTKTPESSIPNNDKNVKQEEKDNPKITKTTFINTNNTNTISKNEAIKNEIAQKLKETLLKNNTETTSPPKLLTWKSLNNAKTEINSDKTDSVVKPIETVNSSSVNNEVKRSGSEVVKTSSPNKLNEIKRNNSENNKSKLQRGNIITKSHEIVKSKIVQHKVDLNETYDSLLDTTELDIDKDTKTITTDRDVLGKISNKSEIVTEKTDNITNLNNITNINIDTSKHNQSLDNNKNTNNKNIFSNKSIFLKKDVCEKINNVLHKNKNIKLETNANEMLTNSNHNISNSTDENNLNNNNDRKTDYVTIQNIESRNEITTYNNNVTDIKNINENKENTFNHEWVSIQNVECKPCDIDEDKSSDKYIFSREIIGEPDGKADSDSSEHLEPPELPKIPPPSVIETDNSIEDFNINNYVPNPPRSSFLHTKKPKSNEITEPKPKIGIKPNGLLYSIPQQFSSPTIKFNGHLSSNNKDIKINSVKIQSNYVELKRRSNECDDDFNKNKLSNIPTEKISKGSAESLESEVSNRDLINPQRNSTSSESDSKSILNGDRNDTKEQDVNIVNGKSFEKEHIYGSNIKSNVGAKSNGDRNESYGSNVLDSSLNEMIDSKIIFDKEYENVMKTPESSRLKTKSWYSENQNVYEPSRAYGRCYSLEDNLDNLKHSNYSDAIERLTGLEENFLPLSTYTRQRSNSYDENFSDTMSNRCETPTESRTKRQAPKPPPTPPLNSHKTTSFGTPIRVSSKPPILYPKPDVTEITPPPRKSSSTDCLADKFTTPDKFTKKIGSSTTATRMRHTLKKFLKLGKEDVDFSKMSSPAPRPRPQIIHPIDFNSSGGVEVVRNSGTICKDNDPDYATLNVNQVKDVVATPPVKPQRTASLRDQKKLKNQSDYETVHTVNGNVSVVEEVSPPEENLYEPLDISGSSNGENEPPSPSSDGSSSGQRSLSYQYAGSETESDIYYPYVFYNNEEGSEEDGWKGRVRVRKSRNVVHKSLEDNYGAVVIANHEALAQMLEQMNYSFISTPAHLKSLKSSPLRFRDFKIIEDSKLCIGGRKYFMSQHNGHQVVISVCNNQCSFLHTKSLPPCFVLTPVYEFMETVSSKIISDDDTDSPKQVSVAILPCVRMCTLSSYTNSSRCTSDNSEKDLGLILIQLVNSVKSLQACGIEDVTETLEEFLLCQEEKNVLPRLCVLPVSDDTIKRISLCQSVSQAIEMLLPSGHLTQLLKDILASEKSSSLTQTKSILEYWLWGPDNVKLNGDEQISLQRWLDLDRATTLHSLVCSRPPQLSPQDYSHLLFLVRTNSKSLLEASNMLDQYKKQNKRECSK